jgi:hypothetical protein
VSNNGSKLSQLYNDRELLVVLDVFQKEKVCRFCHVTVIETVYFIKGYILVTIETEHSHEVCILLITAEEFHFPVA